MADPKPHTPQEQARISRKAAVSRDGSRVKEAVRLAAAAEPVDFPEAEIGRDLSYVARASNVGIRKTSPREGGTVYRQRTKTSEVRQMGRTMPD
ncbi:hypothetical protein E4U33_005070 [Claviceps sp. LM78 group G4]|nr:hypothetical protein E4U33_005070 [Claviceps sp. LM78 group G4]